MQPNLLRHSNNQLKAEFHVRNPVLNRAAMPGIGLLSGEYRETVFSTQRRFCLVLEFDI